MLKSSYRSIRPFPIRRYFFYILLLLGSLLILRGIDLFKPQLDISLLTDKPDIIQVFCDQGTGFTEKYSSSRTVPVESFEGKKFTITLPGACKKIRLDIGASDSTIILQSVTLRRGPLLQINILPNILSGADHEIRREQSRAPNTIKYVSEGTDPYIVLSGDFFKVTQDSFLSFGTKAFIFLALIALAALVEHQFVRNQIKSATREQSLLHHPADAQNQLLHMIGLGIVIFSAVFWHIGQWPGALTHDSIFLIKEAENGVYTTYHPLLNALLLRLLVIPFGSIAIYSTIQAIGCTAVIVYIIHRLRKLGLPPTASFITCVFLAISVPIGAYESMLWKDIPSSFMVLCFSFVFFLGGLKITQDFGKPKIFFVYLAAISLLSFLRHGWEVNIFLVPLLLTCVNNQRKQQLAYIWSGAALSFFIFAILIPKTMNVQNDEAHYSDLTLYVLAQPFISLMDSRNGYVSMDAASDNALYNKIFSSDEAIKNYNPSHMHVLINNYIRPGAGSSISTPEKLEIIKTCILNIQICMTDRFAMFMSTLYPVSPRFGMTYYNLVMTPSCNAILPNEYCNVIEKYAYSAKTNLFLSTTTKVINYSNSIVFPYPKAWIWNAIPGLLLLIGTAFLSRWLPAAALAACFVLLQCLVPFATSGANDFRYYFFIYLCGIFIVPMAITEFYYNRCKE